MNEDIGSRLFNADGTVKLPKLTGIAIGLAAEHPRHKLSHQPTEQRAQAVADALRDRCAARGYGVEVRATTVGADRTCTCKRNEKTSFGVYLVVPAA